MGKFQAAFTGNRDYLASQIQLDVGLWNKLEDRGILTRLQIDTCRRETNYRNNSEQVTALLDILQQAEDEWFDPFCEILEERGQRTVVRKLREKVPAAGASQSSHFRSASGESSAPSGVRPTVSNGRCSRCGGLPHDQDFNWKFRCFISAKRVGLVENLNVDGNFYAYLQQEQILSNPIIHKIQAKGDVYSQKKELLDQLELCEDELLERFLKVLEYNNGQQIARLIRNYFS